MESELRYNGSTLFALLLTEKDEKRQMDVTCFLRTVFGIENEELLRDICAMAAVSDVAKGTLLARCGEPQTQIFFLLEGVFRGFFLDVDGREITDCLGCRCGDVAMASFGLNNPAQTNIEMMTPGKVMSIPAAGLATLMGRYPELLVIYNRLLTEALAFSWEMKIVLYQRTAMERYEWFREKFPGLLDQISNKYVASFLRMNPVTFSRLLHSSAHDT